MSQPAARISDMHVCPMVTPATPPIPHVGGPILPPGVINVLIGNLPAAPVSSMAVCVGPPDVIIPPGAPTVLIGGRPAARMGDMTAHGGSIVMGCFTVLIGMAGAGGAGSMGMGGAGMSGKGSPGKKTICGSANPGAT
jgi:uncharacterized Zn-binding protein involved in type VI secretion